ncbi:unnamed protein product [Rotaria sp. Silwood1]|nr:unnamed protein product [Rotaria sp. Silwood1]CAF3540606.1 unnamed protein product [Rotaria sp. Silwood1]CAF3567030.1 unnamed protein product [Rotaria sp. Silwood1]CAF3609511.1 unnamed protein product [Rotaria sp. Silwood1]
MALTRLDIDKIIDDSRLKLDKWRDSSLKKFNRFYDNKCDELERYYTQKVRQQQKEIDQLYKQLNEFNQKQNTIHEDNLNELQTNILNVKQKIAETEQKFISIHIRSLAIDKNLIIIGEMKIQEFDLTTLLLPYQTLNVSENFGFGLAIHAIIRSLATFDQLFSIRLDIKYVSYQLPIRCCSLQDNEWLVVEANTSQLFHIGREGKLKGTVTYDQPPYKVLLFGSNILVIRTDSTINFHEVWH